MNFVYLIGNGFDISCGLKTKFPNFFDYILENEEKVEKNNIYRKIDSDIKNKINDWADFETEIGTHTQSLSEKDSDLFLTDLHEISNDLHEYLLQQQWPKDKIFEKDISKVLQNTIQNFYLGADELSTEIIKKKLYENYSNNFKVDIISFNYTNTLDIILNNTQVKTFKDNFTSYQTSRTYINDKIMNVHGILDTGIVLGLNDESQFNNKIFKEDTHDEIIKPKMIEYHRNTTYKKAMNKIENSDIIVIYGMSISKTDKIWWQKIGAELLNNNNKILVIHVYEEVETKYTIPYIIKKHRESLYNKYIDVLDGEINDEKLTEDNIKIIKGKIHFVINSSYMFNL